METEQKKKNKNIIDTIITITGEIIFFFRFLILVFFVFWWYLLDKSPNTTLEKPQKRIRLNLNFLIPIYRPIYRKVIRALDCNTCNNIFTSDLILLAMRNLSSKKNRTLITVGGMAVGFGFVILLLSFGYGFEKLVVSQVATLNQMRQIDVNISQGSPLSFNDNVMKEICDMEDVDEVLPIITAVSKVSYNNAVSDIIVYGVTTRYLQEMDLTPIRGEVFEDDINMNKEISFTTEDTPEVAGVSTNLISSNSYKKEIYQIEYSILPSIWKPVYSQPNIDSEIIGYTKRDFGRQDSIEIWGKYYPGLDQTSYALDYKGDKYAPWIEDEFSIWEKRNCESTNPDCIDKKYLIKRDKSYQVVTKGYITQGDVTVSRYRLSKNSNIDVYTGKNIENIKIDLKKDNQYELYFDPDIKSKSINIIVKENDLRDLDANLVYGDVYYNDGGYSITTDTKKTYGYWIKTTIELWNPQECDTNCSDYFLTKLSSSYISTNVTGYLKASDVYIQDLDSSSITKGEVLGENIQVLGLPDNFVDIDTLIELDESVDWAEMAERLDVVGEIEKKIVKINGGAQKVVLANTSMLNLLGVNMADGIDQSFDATFVFDNKLFDKSNYIIETEEETLRIIGVVSDSRQPAFYIPFNDIRVDEMENVSNIKIVLNDSGDIKGVRETIEGMGFQTSSIVDTIESIGSLFNSLRIALLVLGLIALGVASLGMFNTLTVSLLEKTREVGLLKTMGMKSREIKILFLAESIIMSFTGGITGILFGFFTGKIISLIVSILALSQGQNIINLTYIPSMLMISTIILSFIVGFLTGWYPAKRATTVSALNALRYE